MGQRLNIEIKNNEKVLANCYYHWSGFTLSSLGLTKKIINYMKGNKVKSDVDGAVLLLKQTGAEYPGKNRNSGLIKVDHTRMEETREWEEGRITINIDQETFDFNCVWENDYIEDEEIWELIKHKFLKIKIKSKYNIPFYEIDYLIESIEKAQNEYEGRFYFGLYCFKSIH